MIIHILYNVNIRLKLKTGLGEFYFFNILKYILFVIMDFTPKQKRFGVKTFDFGTLFLIKSQKKSLLIMDGN